MSPAFFSLALHRALEEANARLQPGEALIAYLDDVYILTRPERTRAAFDTVTQVIENTAGIRPNLGKCACWNARAGEAPPGIAELGSEEDKVWRGDGPEAERGLIILGNPVGTAEFVRTQAQQRMEKEQGLLDWLPKMGDLQCAWLLLALCATPRANHVVRALPPTQAREYAAEHDSRIWNTLQQLLGHAPHRDRARRARTLAALPGRLGGLGLRSAERTSPAAYWASWADALEVIRQRRPNEAAAFLAELERVGGAQAPCLREVQEAADLLDHEGFEHAGVGARPSWRELFEGARPPQREDRGETEPGEWINGWQFYASSTRETHYREHHLMPNMSRASRATLRSQSGPQAAAWLTAVPTSPATTLLPVLFQICLRRRLRLPLMLSNRRCEGCRAILDSLGDHRAACSVSGRLRRRAKPIELAWSAVFTEAGAVVPNLEVFECPQDRLEVR